MRKFLLLSAAALTAATAMAELTDVTPKAYNFNSGLELPFVNAYQNEDWNSLPWNPGAYIATKSPEVYKDGLILMVGPMFKESTATFDTFVAGTKIVDLGGEVGKVLCFGGTASDAQSALQKRGIEVELPSYATSPGYLIPLWHADPNVHDGLANGVERACRIQVVLNIFENNATGTASHFQPYLQTGSNGTLEDNNAPDRYVYSTDFCYTWGEAEAEDNRIDFATASDDDLALYSTDEGDYFAGLGDANSGYVWNPNRWMVYEFDAPFMSKPEDEGSFESDCPIKIKMEMPELNGTTVFIRSVKFLMKDAQEEAIPAATRKKSWIYLKAGGESSIADVAADSKALDLTVDGNTVNVAEAAVIYSVTGAKVASVAAGESVELANGFYIANANGKSVKFAVK